MGLRSSPNLWYSFTRPLAVSLRIRNPTSYNKFTSLEVCDTGSPYFSLHFASPHVRPLWYRFSRYVTVLSLAHLERLNRGRLSSFLYVPSAASPSFLSHLFSPPTWRDPFYSHFPYMGSTIFSFVGPLCCREAFFGAISFPAEVSVTELFRLSSVSLYFPFVERSVDHLVLVHCPPKPIEEE